MARARRFLVRTLEQRGSALLVSLMVMVGLSLLGLGFVAVSETESAISVNERNYAQVQATSEAGAKLVVEWFQNPEWALSKGIMPANGAAEEAAIKGTRFIDTNADSVPDDIGEYKEGADYDEFCCEKPFKPGRVDRLWGDEDHPDMLVDDTTAPTFLAAFNAAMMTNAQQTGRITEIRVYAPPIIGGTVNANGFIEGGTRYGLATIRVTATKYANNNTDILAQRSTKVVISEWPFPGPQGPVQSNANIATGGNVIVHWGKMTSQGTMFVKRELVGFPWHHASHFTKHEYGYDSSRSWSWASGGSPRVLQTGDIVRPTDATLAELYAFEVQGGPCSIPNGTAEPAVSEWTTPNLANPPFTSTCTWKTISAPRYHVDGGNLFDAEEWLYELVGKSFDDPWVEVRSRGAFTNSSVTSCCLGVSQPFRYTAASQDELDDAGIGLSNWFQNQDITDFAVNKKEVTFPRIDYKFWKATATAAKGQEGVYYFTWAGSADNFRDSKGVVKTFKQWTNHATGAKPGFYFFDTKNAQNPQVPGGGAYLTPGFKVSNVGGAEWQMAGFIYLNSEDFGTTGVSGKDGRYANPGEPFADIGYYRADPGTNALIINSGAYVVDTAKAGNRRWDCQFDLNGDTDCDIFIAPRIITRPGDATTATVYLPVPYRSGCTPGSNGDVGANCSEPHEPYVNLIYPQDSCCVSGSYPVPLQVGWEDPAGTITRRPKKFVSPNVLPTVDGSDICTNSAEFDEYCTSNKYDRDGYLDEWAGNGQNGAPVLNGVFYNEGMMNDTSGNARYFGSVLINGDINPLGTAEVWFDERLIKDEWPPKEWPFPRAFITSISTDQ